MRLDITQMKAITKGVMDVTEENGVFVFHRLSAAQMSIYKPDSTGWRRSQSLASVLLDFETDAVCLRFEAVNAWNATGTRNYYFDMFVDEKLVCHDGFSYNPNENGDPMMRLGDRRNEWALPAGTKRIRLYLPGICHAELRNVELENASFVRPVKNKYRWLAFGDSITDAHSSALPSMQYTEQVARAVDAEVFNQAIAGEQYMARKIVSGSYPKVDLITVAYGTNDFRHCPEKAKFLQKVEGFYKALNREFGDTPVLVLLPLWRKVEDQTFALGSLTEVRSMIAQIASAYTANRVVDCSGFVPPVSDFFADKTLHPNALGHTFYAKGLLPWVQDILKK